MKTLLFSTLLLLIPLSPKMTVNGPTIIDIIGFDGDLQSLYFTKTHWAECDECQTDLNIYNLLNDSLTIVKNWSDRNVYRKQKEKVLKTKNLYSLTRLDTIRPKDNPVLFNWLPRQKYYNRTLMKETLNSPFEIKIQNKSFIYTQCLDQNKKPEINQFAISEINRIVHIRYQGECHEGNTVDELIYYEYKNGEIFSRDLNE